MSFKKYRKTRGYSIGAAIRIQKGGAIYINRPCLDEFFKGCNFVTIWLDKERCVIGFKPSKEICEDAFSILGQTNGGKLLSTQKVMKLLGVDCPKVLSYKPVWSEVEQGMFEIDLKED